MCIADNSLVILNSIEMKENVTDSSNHLVVLVQGLKLLLLCACPVMATFCLGQYCSVPSISFIHCKNCLATTFLHSEMCRHFLADSGIGIEFYVGGLGVAT